MPSCLGDATLYGKIILKNSRFLKLVKKVERSAQLNLLDKCKEELENLEAALDVLDDEFEEYEKTIKPEDLTKELDTYNKEADMLRKCHDECNRVVRLYQGVKDGANAVNMKGMVSSTSGEQFQISDLAKCFNSNINRPYAPMSKYEGNHSTHALWMDAFDKRIAKKLTDDHEIVCELLHYLEGDAEKAVRRVAFNPDKYTYLQVRAILDQKFGKKVVVAQQLKDELLQGPPVVTATDMSNFLDDVATFGEAIVHCKYDPHLDVMAFADELMDRLDPHFRRKWNDAATDYYTKNNKYPDYNCLANFLKQKMALCDDPFLGANAANKAKLRRDKKATVHNMQMVSATEQAYNQQPFNQQTSFRKPPQQPYRPGNKPTSRPSTADPTSCPICNTKHTLAECPEFKAKNVDDRKDTCKRFRFCFKCLLPGHLVYTCPSPIQCGYEECSGKHHRLLHGASLTPAYATNGHTYATNLQAHDNPKILLPIVKVCINGTNTFALLDPGSSITLITNKLVKQLNLSGPRIDFSLQTVNSRNDMLSQLISCSVRGYYESVTHSLYNCVSVPDLPAHNPEVASREIASYEHLKDIPWTPAQRNQVDLLIGQDHTHLLLTHEYRLGKKGEPIAIKTPLGWAIQGPIASSMMLKRAAVNLCSLYKPPPEVYHDITRLWSFEHNDETKTAWSQDDHFVFQMWEKEWTSVNGRYQLPIPFKNPNVCFPNNRVQAQTRLQQTLRGLRKKGKFDSYKVEIDLMLEKGYAEHVPKSDLNRDDGKVFYLPHFPVYHPDKPLKTRPVHDAAAEYQGMSLNNQCYSGPNLTTPLVDVLTRFREYIEALGSDVTAMYLQLLIPVHQRDVLRFLWIDEDGKLIELRMTRHIFGGIWCAASTTYAIRRAMKEAGASHVISKILEESMYVDDLLYSPPPHVLASQLAETIRALGESKNFCFVKWNGTPLEILNLIPTEFREKEDREIETDPNTKTLGIRWNMTSDEFFYGKRYPLPNGSISKRTMLSLVASVYDPIGLISPLIIFGRIMLQRATRLKAGWDDSLPDDIVKPWVKWWNMLDDLPDIKFPRCIIGNMDPSLKIELHHFCDASENAFGTTAYARVVDHGGNQIHTALIRAKGKVAPTKGGTIPRLELCAGVEAVDLNSELLSQLRLKVSRVYFWTDSEIVLKYLNSTHLRLKLFVANRVAHILGASTVSQWNHVPTHLNPGDIISRGSTVADLPDLWKYGPPFLKLPESEWPKQPDCNLPDDALEIKRPERLFQVSTGQKKHPVITLLEYYQHDAHRACKALSWWRRLISSRPTIMGLLSCNKPPEKECKKASFMDLEPIRPEELKAALHEYILFEQARHYKKEIKSISLGEHVPSTSPILSLNPTIMNGLLVVGGRIRRAELKPEIKHPIILSKESLLSSAILHEYHSKAHLGIDWVLTQVRERFHIPGARGMLRNIRSKCTFCKKQFDKPQAQLMSDLPEERLKPGGYAFSYTGIDLFGPFFVTQGRSTVKRYGVIFTCLRIRAVHIEVAASLSAESFILAYNRFTARRGYPVLCKSDRGTNIVGATEEMRKAWVNVDSDVIKNNAARDNTKWTFNTPSDSAAGGIWERQIRTIRKVLVGILNPNVKLDDELLSTVMCQAEQLINSRPITYTGDAADCTPLTPNHLLMLQRNSPMDVTGINTGLLFREKWKHLESLVDTFWKQWSREYLLNLQHRDNRKLPLPNLTTGDLVLMMEPNLPRGEWRMGIVTDVTRKLRDGYVRSVGLRTSKSHYERPVSKLVKLGLKCLPETI